MNGDPNDVLTRQEVATLLRYDSITAFYRDKPRLTSLGFPKPAYGNGRGARWLRSQITTWMQGLAGQNGFTPEPDKDRMIDETLEARLATI